MVKKGSKAKPKNKAKDAKKPKVDNKSKGNAKKPKVDNKSKGKDSKKPGRMKKGNEKEEGKSTKKDKEKKDTKQNTKQKQQQQQGNSKKKVSADKSGKGEATQHKKRNLAYGLLKNIAGWGMEKGKHLAEKGMVKGKHLAEKLKEKEEGLMHLMKIEIGHMKEKEKERKSTVMTEDDKKRESIYNLSYAVSGFLSGLIWAHAFIFLFKLKKCGRFLVTPTAMFSASFGGLFFLLFLAGFIGRRYDHRLLMLIHVIGRRALIILLLCFCAVGFLMTLKGQPKTVKGTSVKDYRLKDYSYFLAWMLKFRIVWKRAKLCLEKVEVCKAVTFSTMEDFYGSKLTDLEYGCCRPPTICGYEISASKWMPISASNMPASKDCGAWDPTGVLCLDCDSCRAAMVQTMKQKCQKLMIVSSSFLGALVFIWLLERYLISRHDAKREENQELEEYMGNEWDPPMWKDVEEEKREQMETYVHKGYIDDAINSQSMAASHQAQQGLYPDYQAAHDQDVYGRQQDVYGEQQYLYDPQYAFGGHDNQYSEYDSYFEQQPYVEEYQHYQQTQQPDVYQQHQEYEQGWDYPQYGEVDAYQQPQYAEVDAYQQPQYAEVDASQQHQENLSHEQGWGYSSY